MRARGIRRIQIVFATLLTICVGQLAWWLMDGVHYTRVTGDRLVTQLRREAGTAAELRAAGVPDDRIAGLLPELELSADGTWQPSARILSEIRDSRAHRLRRWTWEGTFFLVVLLAAIGVLVRALRREAELRRRQQNFLASVSHEFKSPIASLMLDTGTLSLRDPPAEARRRLLGRMGETLERLEGMVTNLLETARIEEGHFRQELHDVRLASAARTAVTAVNGHATGPDVAFEVDVPEDLVVRADDAAVGTVLRNLLDNARKATLAAAQRPATDGTAALAVPAPAPVRLTARVDGRRVRLDVTDRGEGFEAQQADRLFEKFYRPGNELRRGGRGSGLGLYIVRQLVERGGGRVAARSEGPGRGATFTVFWPRGEDIR